MRFRAETPLWWEFLGCTAFCSGYFWVFTELDCQGSGELHPLTRKDLLVPSTSLEGQRRGAFPYDLKENTALSLAALC